MNDSHIKVKLFGESFSIYPLVFAVEDLEKYQGIATQLNQPLNIALLNFDFYLKLRDEHINSIQDIKTKSIGGLINTNQSQVEIWVDRKKLSKFKVSDVVNINTLFPLYNTHIETIVPLNLFQGLYLVEREVGLIGTHEIKTSKFEIDALQFKLIELEHDYTRYELLSGLRYNGNEVTSTKSDTLLRYQYCFMK